MRIPGSTTNDSRASVSAIAGVDEAGRVDDRDPVSRRQAGARLDEPGVAVGDGNRQAGADERALAGPELDVLARR
jgi:hypothetical protein